jgi:hypothetical protein
MQNIKQQTFTMGYLKVSQKLLFGGDFWPNISEMRMKRFDFGQKMVI